MSQTLEQQSAMYGMTVEAIQEALARSQRLSRTPSSGAHMLSASLQSDVQELMALALEQPARAPEYLERARQHLNVSKYILFGMDS